MELRGIGRVRLLFGCCVGRGSFLRLLVFGRCIFGNCRCSFGILLGGRHRGLLSLIFLGILLLGSLRVLL